MVTDQTGAQVSLTEYQPYGAVSRETGTYNPEFKFNGKELDATTGLYYYGARYYDMETGRFTQADNFQLDFTNYQSFKEKTNPNNPVLANEGKAKEEKQGKLKEFLGEPQNLNIYGYALNNPLRYTDPSGQTVWDMINGRQSWSQYQVEVGQGADQLYNNSSLAKTIMDHPYATGAAIGVGGGLMAYGAVAGMTWLGLIAPAGQQVAQQSDKINKVIDFTIKYGQNFGGQMNRVAQGLKSSGYNFSTHAIYRIAQKIGLGNEGKVVNILNNIKPFEYLHEGILKLGYYDNISRIFIGQEKATGNVITVITDVTGKYINNLMK